MNNSTLAALSNLSVSLLNVKKELVADSEVRKLWDENIGVDIDELPGMAMEMMNIVQEADGMRHAETDIVINVGDRVRVRMWDELLKKDEIDVTWHGNALAVGKRYFSRAMGKFGGKVLVVCAVACDHFGMYYRLADTDGVDVGFSFDNEMLEKVDC